MEKRLLILTKSQFKNILRFGLITMKFENTGMQYLREKYDITIGIYDKSLSYKYKPKCLTEPEIMNWMDIWNVSEETADDFGWNIIYYTSQWESNMPCSYKQLISEFNRCIGDVEQIKVNKYYKTHEVMEKHIDDMINKDKKLVRMLTISEIIN